MRDGKTLWKMKGNPKSELAFLLESLDELERASEGFETWNILE